ncbi:hypothetical protein V5738_09025 [Salinisphaera sp. SPP-AMP-43]|uniref:metal ABC transporter permease n=1 Tax=Salinisphaera sp. SPP-AMP-43 TaxID=3121288 RepID=UPI003C6E290F
MRAHRINRKRMMLAGTIALGSALITLPALAQQQSQHLRGQITATASSGFTLTTRDGQKRQIALTDDTKIAAVTKGDLSSIDKGTFIGTANVESDGQHKALEMVIFPPSMKGTGLGDYAWDLTPAMAGASSSGSRTADGSSMTNGSVTAQSQGSMSADSSMGTGSSMTNGTVSSKNKASMTADGSSMTNGTVTQQSGAKASSITLQVDYGEGTKTIVVPADVPTVKVQPGQRSDIKTGAHVFVAGPTSDGTVQAARVIVGRNGVVPPM